MIDSSAQRSPTETAHQPCFDALRLGLASWSLESLPHDGALVTLFSVFGVRHKEGYYVPCRDGCHPCHTARACRGHRVWCVDWSFLNPRGNGYRGIVNLGSMVGLLHNIVTVFV